MFIKEKDLALVKLLANDDPASHKCRLYHDEGFLQDTQAEKLIQLGVKVERESDGYLRPLCKDVKPDTVSVGCAHKEQYRIAIRSVLLSIASSGHNKERCIALHDEILKIGDEINSRRPDCLDRAMVDARSNLTFEGQRIRNDIGDRHTALVDRLFAINNETLALFYEAIERETY